MATPTATTARRKSPTKPRTQRPPVSGWFKQWLKIRDEIAVSEDRTGKLRKRMLDAVTQHGEEDDKGNVFYSLPEAVRFEDHDGDVTTYRSLKVERHLTPANPTPDPDKAEAFLREKNLWLTKAQEKAIRDIAIASPYVHIVIEVDPDAVAQAYFKNVIDEEEYDTLLVEQRESFQFRPQKA